MIPYSQMNTFRCRFFVYSWCTGNIPEATSNRLPKSKAGLKSCTYKVNPVCLITIAIVIVIVLLDRPIRHKWRRIYRLRTDASVIAANWNSNKKATAMVANGGFFVRSRDELFLDLHCKFNDFFRSRVAPGCFGQPDIEGDHMTILPFCR